MRCWLLLPLTLLATPALAEEERDPETLCTGELNTCRDGCSMDFGASYEKRTELMTCISRCDERHDLCLLKFVAKRKVVIPNKPGETQSSKPADQKDAAVAPYLMPRTRYSDPDPAVKRPEAQTPTPAPVANDAVAAPDAGSSAPRAKPRKKQIRESISRQKGDDTP